MPYISRFGRPIGSRHPMKAYSSEATIQYLRLKDTFQRSDEDEARLRDLQRDSSTWDQADQQLYDDIMARDDDREDLKRAPLRRETEGFFDRLNLPPLPPTLPRSSIWLWSQHPHSYPVEEIRPFLLACQDGVLDEVQKWIPGRKDILRRMGLQDGLACAAKGNQVHVARYLLEEGGASLHGGVVEAACKNLSLPLFELCIEHGYHPNQQVPSPTGSFGVALPHCLGDEDIVRLLLSHGADPDLDAFKDGRNWNWGHRATPPMDRTAGRALDIAVEKSTLPTIQLLLEHGANPNYARPLKAVINRRSGLASEADAEDDWLPRMQLLLDHGAKINTTTHTGGTPLISAIGKNMWDVVEFLLDHGADPMILHPATKQDAFSAAAKHAGIVWEYNDALKSYLNHLCDFNSNSKDADAPTVPDGAQHNPLVQAVVKVRKRKQGASEAC